MSGMKAARRNEIFSCQANSANGTSQQLIKLLNVVPPFDVANNVDVGAMWAHSMKPLA